MSENINYREKTRAPSNYKKKLPTPYTEGEDPKNDTGRPERDFDKRMFEQLCHVHCTYGEIEAILATDCRTLDKWCRRTYKEGLDSTYKKCASGGKASLRRSQMKLAETNASVAIWLGKVLLGQRDMAEIDEKINRALGILETAKKLRVVDDRANTIAETNI